MFSRRAMSEEPHHLTAGGELVEWEAVRSYGFSAKVAATLGSALLLLIGVPPLYLLLYGVPHPQKIAAVSKESAPHAVKEQAALLREYVQPASLMEILELQPGKAVRSEEQRFSVRQAQKGAVQGTTQGNATGAKPSTVPRAWYVQVAAFSKRGAAKQLTHQAKTAGFPALLYDGGSFDKPRFRVLVGPQSSSAAARQMQHRVGRLLFLNGTFVRYIE